MSEKLEKVLNDLVRIVAHLVEDATSEPKQEKGAYIPMVSVVSRSLERASLVGSTLREGEVRVRAGSARATEGVREDLRLLAWPVDPDHIQAARVAALKSGTQVFIELRVVDELIEEARRDERRKAGVDDE